MSTAVPSPTDGPGSGVPGMYRGATTSGKRNVTSPSAYGRTPHSVSSTVARSPGIRLPTRRLKTPGRSSSAIAARWPAAIACSYVFARLSALFQHSLDDPAGNLHAKTGHGRAIGQREDVRRLERLVERVHEDLPHRDRHKSPSMRASTSIDSSGKLPALRSQRAETRLVPIGSTAKKCRESIHRLEAAAAVSSSESSFSTRWCDFEFDQ